MDDGTVGRPVAGANERALGGSLNRVGGALLFALLGACAATPPGSGALAGVALTSAPGQFPGSPNDSVLFGRWESASTSRGGIGQTLEFTATYHFFDKNGPRFVGRMVATVGARVDGTYRTDGERLMRRVPDAPDEVVAAYTQHGDTLVLGSQRMDRLAASTSRSGIVGRWSYRHTSGATAIEEYGDDGTWRFRLPFRSDTSIYEVHGDSISAYAGAMAGNYTWSVSTGTLRLARLDATVPVALYNRAPERR